LRSAGEGRAKQRYGMSARGDAFEDFVQMDFCAAAQRVPDILPVQNEDLHGKLFFGDDAYRNAGVERQRRAPQGFTNVRSELR